MTGAVKPSRQYRRGQVARSQRVWVLGLVRLADDALGAEAKQHGDAIAGHSATSWKTARVRTVGEDAA